MVAGEDLKRYEVIFDISKTKSKIMVYCYRVTYGFYEPNSLYLMPDDPAAFEFCCMLPASLSVERLLPVIADDELGDLGG